MLSVIGGLTCQIASILSMLTLLDRQKLPACLQHSSNSVSKKIDGKNYRNLKLYRGRIVISKPDKNKLRQKRHTRVRGKISGTSETPRLNVFRSNTNIYAQVIDDVTGTTLASASSLKLTGTKTEQAAEVGKLVAEAAKAKGVEEVVFDRGGYLYHGRVAALATAAREAGLKF